MSKLGKTIDEIFDGVVDEETVDGKISQALEDAKAYTDNELASLKIMEIVATLPDVGEPNKIYLVLKTNGETNDLYDEYLWVNNTWEYQGTKKVEVDLSDYLKKTTVSSPLYQLYGTGYSTTDTKMYSAFPDSAIMNWLAMYGTGGTLAVGTPTKDTHAVNKGFADSTYVAISTEQQTASGGLYAPFVYTNDEKQDHFLAATDRFYTAYNIPMIYGPLAGKNELNGYLLTATPINSYHCANKKYVDEAVANAGGGGGLTVDKIVSIDNWNAEVTELYAESEGITWSDFFAFLDNEGNPIHTGEVDHKVPIVAGNGITFEYNDDHNAIKINATGGGGLTIEDVQSEIYNNLFDGKSLASEFGAEYDEEGNLLTISQVYARKDEIENGGGGSSEEGETEDYLTEAELGEYLTNNGYVMLPPGENIEDHVRLLFEMGSISANDIQVFAYDGQMSLMDYLDTIGGGSSSALGTKVTLAQLQENLSTYCEEKRIIRIVPTTDSILRDMEQCQGAILVPLKNPSGVPYGVLYTSHTEGTEDDAYYYMYSLSISPTSASISYSLYYHVYKDMSGTLDSDQRMDLDDDICEFYVI